MGAVTHHHYVSAIDVLERVIHANLKKISLFTALFRQWAQAKSLKPSETRYVCRVRGETVDPRFGKSGDPMQVLRTLVRAWVRPAACSGIGGAFV